MNELFNREDLKSGFLVKLKNGELRMVARAENFSKILVNEAGEWCYLSSHWRYDLTRYTQYKQANYEIVPGKSQDIVEVYGLVQGTKNYRETFEFSTEHRPLLWEKTPPKKMTIAEISKALGFRVEIVAETDDDDTDN